MQLKIDVKNPALFLLTALVAAGGCTLGPKYQKPLAAAPQSDRAFTVNGVVWKTAVPAADHPRGEWWTSFGDTDLNVLEQTASTRNQNLVGTVAALTQARSLAKEARSLYFPQIAVDPNYSRNNTSLNAPVDGLPAGTAYHYNLYTLPAELSWEIDLFGRIRRQVEGARERMVAANDDLLSLRLLVQAEVAEDYFTLRAQDAEIKVLMDTAQTYRRSLELTRNRRKGGVATDLDVSEADTQLRSTEAQIPALRLQRAQMLHAIAVLCGQPAMSFQIPERTGQLFPEVAVPSLVPSELLERRPDIAAAERRVAAANADVGVAQTAFYPSLVFNASAGLQSISAGTLLDWPSRFWSLGPELNLPIFTGGYNRAQLAATRAEYDLAVANYRQTALVAFQDVEDQLAAQQLLASQLEGENAALTSARQTLDIANNRYKAGLVTYLEVATSQSAELDVERTVVELEGQRRVAAVGLIKAIGGGWN